MADPISPGNGCPRWVKIVLGLSLAVNIAVVGLVAGFFLRGGPMRDGPMAMGYAAPYVIALPREMRREVFGVVRADASLPDRKARRARYAEMIQALKADPFDPARVEEILVRQGAEGAQVQDVSRAAWLDAVSTMDTVERQSYVERIEEVLRRGKRDKKGKRN